MAVRSSIAANGDTELALVTKPRRTTNRLSFHFGNAVPTPRSLPFIRCSTSKALGQKPFLSRPKSAPSDKRIQAGRRGVSSLAEGPWKSFEDLVWDWCSI